MCGIFGFQIYNKDNLDIKKLTRNLIKLSQKRGYDSSGLCINSKHGYQLIKKPQSGLDLIKSKDFKNLFLDKDFENSNIQTLIGQCRLQTEGAKYMSYNNQPIDHEEICLVHNGIITNYKEIEKKIDVDQKDKSFFDSSDTLILTKYINSFLKKNQSAKELFENLNNIVEGSFSIAFIDKKNNNLVLGTNTGSLHYIINESFLIFGSEETFLKELDKILKLGKSLKIKKLMPKTYLEIRIPNKSDNFEKNKKNSFINLSQKQKDLKKCSNCILPETYPYITFDEKNVCNYCSYYAAKPKIILKDKLKYLLDKYRSKNSDPDCLVGLSGGRDSCYGLHVLKKEYGMNPIAYTYDWGLTSDISRINQAKITGALEIEHIIRSPDIQKKRDNIRCNVNAWLKKPKLGMVPLFMAGDKDFYEYGRVLKKENNLGLTVFASGQIYEQRNFFIGFCGVKKYLELTPRLYDYPLQTKLQLALYYATQYITNPRYINRSFFDSIRSFFTSFIFKDNFLYLFEYIKWDEKKIMETLTKEYNWTSDIEYGKNQWRMGDGQTQFTNYIFYKLTGFSEFDNFRSAQIRDGLISREEGLDLAKEDNRPKYEKIEEFCNTVGLSTNKVLTEIELIEPIY